VIIVLPCPEKQKGNVPSSKRAENFKKIQSGFYKTRYTPSRREEYGIDHKNESNLVFLKTVFDRNNSKRVNK